MSLTPMPEENPYAPASASAEQPEGDWRAAAGNTSVRRDSRTFFGLNLRWEDNRFQALFILFAVLVCGVIGSFSVLFNRGWSLPWYGGAVIGGFVGLVVGLLASGAVLLLFQTLGSGRRNVD